jgi:hypothetical protein
MKSGPCTVLSTQGPTELAAEQSGAAFQNRRIDIEDYCTSSTVCCKLDRLCNNGEHVDWDDKELQ